MLQLAGGVGLLYVLVAAASYWLFLRRGPLPVFVLGHAIRRWMARTAYSLRLGRLRRIVSRYWRWWRARYAWGRWRGLGGAAVLLCVLLLGVAWVAALRLGWAMPDMASPADARVSRLLLGDELVPPPGLPPEAFVLAEAQLPMIASANRDWDKLDARFRPTLIRLLNGLQANGYPFVVIEGYRSPERQEVLANLGQHVTQARAFQSYHQYGLAADLAPVRDGRIVISERDPWAAEAYQMLGQQAESLGLTWGGRWKMMDLMHVELRLPRSTLRQMLPEAMAKAGMEQSPGGVE